MKCINEKSLAHAAFVVAVTLTVPSAFAIELVCKGHQPQARNQRVIQVDCADRKKVIDALSAAWMTLRKEKIGGSTENMCWEPYNRAKEIHPSIQMSNIAPTFFMQCNMALQYIKD